MHKVSNVEFFPVAWGPFKIPPELVESAYKSWWNILLEPGVITYPLIYGLIS